MKWLAITCATLLAAGVIALAAGRIQSCRADEAARRDGWDVARQLAIATQHAQAWHDDAELVSLVAARVTADGRAHLEGDDPLAFAFRSATEGTGGACLFVAQVEGRRAGMTGDVTAGECGGAAVAPLKCGIPEIWKRALARGANPGAPAQLENHVLGGARVWTFAQGDEHYTLADDCR